MSAQVEQFPALGGAWIISCLDFGVSVFEGVVVWVLAGGTCTPDLCKGSQEPHCSGLELFTVRSKFWV